MPAFRMPRWLGIIPALLLLASSSLLTSRSASATSDPPLADVPATAEPTASGVLSTEQQPTPPRSSLPPPEPVYSDPTYMVLPGGTTVSPERFYSPTLQRSMPYEVILPPGYHASDRAYPVVYLLHGYDGWSHSWIELGLHQTADYLWSDGRLEPFIIVLPEGSNSYFLNHADNGPRWADYLVEDLVRQIDTDFRTLPSAPYRAIGGLSMGGDGALQLALNYPAVFSIVGAHSPTTRLTYDQAPGPFYGDQEYWQRHNPVWLIEQGFATSQRIWIDIGQEDRWLPSARAIHTALLDAGLEHAYREYPGDHGGEYWIVNAVDYLQFYAQSFGPNTLAVARSSQSLR